MIKVRNGVATRTLMPDFLRGLDVAALGDLSWTDPELGVHDCAWWPEVDESPALQQYQRYGDESLTVDAAARVVRVVRSVVPWTVEEIAQAKLAADSLLQQSCIEAVQQKLDAVARQRNYDSMLSLASYLGSANPRFATEAAAGVTWRDACWAYCYQLLDAVRSGRQEAPDVETLLASLPPIIWPEGEHHE